MYLYSSAQKLASLLFNPLLKILFLVMVITVVSLVPQSATSQNGEPKRATLKGWETDLRLFIKDRTNNLGGLAYDRGLFRLTTVPMDMEYQLDIFTYRHSYLDDYRWHNSADNGNGFRSSVGSLNTAKFAVNSQLRSRVELSGRSSLDFTAYQQQDMRANRALILMNYSHSLGSQEYGLSPHRLGITHTLGQAKSDLDASFYYRYGNLGHGTITAEFTALDWANNFVSDLSAGRNSDFEIRQIYSQIPFLYTLRLESPQFGIFRGEAVAAFQPESRAEVIRLELPDENYLVSDWANYQAALLEAARKNFTAGIIWQRTFARMEREPSLGSDYPFDYGNRQIQQRGGIYFTWYWRGFGIEQWFWTERNRDQQFDENPEVYAAQEPQFEEFGSSPERYPFNFSEIRRFNKTRIFYAPADRLLSIYLEHNGDWRDLGMDGHPTIPARNYRNYYPNHILDRNERLTLGIGFAFNEQASLTLGASIDLDGDLIHGMGWEREDATRSYFDGGFGRLQILW
ncbi:hypothetical protein BH23BAC3_BH23BAC3_14180 [soil metagenome]